jgi:hypothetical protein
MSSGYGASKSATVYRNDSNESYQTRSYFTAVYGANRQYDVYYHSDYKKWGSAVWWIPPSNLPPAGSFAEFTFVASLVNGLQVTPYLLWQTLPWTWLIDWFSNIGDWISLSYNVLGATSGRYCIMERTDNYAVIKPVGSSDGWVADSTARVLWLKRTPVAFIGPEIHMPFLTNDMMVSLGSLAVQRLF